MVLPDKIKMFNGYGQIEFLFTVTCYKFLREGEIKYGSVERPNLGVNLHILDEKITIKCPTPPSLCGGFWSENLENQKEFLDTYLFKENDEFYYNFGDLI